MNTDSENSSNEQSVFDTSAATSSPPVEPQPEVPPQPMTKEERRAAEIARMKEAMRKKREENPGMYKFNTTAGPIALVIVVVLFIVAIVVAVSQDDSSGKTGRNANVTPRAAKFSSWDGSHYGLVAYVKKQMKNPDSFDHISTVKLNEGGSYVVTMKFRGTNSFGGVVPQSVTAKVDKKTGKVISCVWGD
ncbi:hypothetical protein [Poriferisphaera sp. WC338]|uniref:hypothetical protein n=1 Tax=Poriferisphaera sp. WC338 TaxID=3425129 RepID=UPI003D81670F